MAVTASPPLSLKKSVKKTNLIRNSFRYFKGYYRCYKQLQKQIYIIDAKFGQSLGLVIDYDWGAPEENDSLRENFSRPPSACEQNISRPTQHCTMMSSGSTVTWLKALSVGTLKQTNKKNTEVVMYIDQRPWDEKMAF